MKYILITLGLLLSAPVFAGGVNLSIHVGDPHFFGRIDIDGVPPPPLLFPKPLIITPPGVHVDVAPIYLHVRPEEARHWRRYCRRYDACGRPVYFVRDRWYDDVYVPHYRSHHEEFEHREHERMEHERMERERMRHERMERERMERERRERHERWQERHDDHRDHRGHDERHDHRDDRRDDRRDDHGPDRGHGHDRDDRHDRDDHDHH